MSGREGELQHNDSSPIPYEICGVWTSGEAQPNGCEAEGGCGCREVAALRAVADGMTTAHREAEAHVARLLAERDRALDLYDNAQRWGERMRPVVERVPDTVEWLLTQVPLGSYPQARDLVNDALKALHTEGNRGE